MAKSIFPLTRRDADKQGIRFPSEQNRNALFPTRLRELRKEKQISQQTLANTLGIAKSTVGYWENGDSLPDAQSLAALADLYGVSADYMLGRSDVKSTEMSIQEICDSTGLREGTVELLMELQQSVAAQGDESPKDMLILGAVDLLMQCRELMAEIGLYLLFRFDHFEVSGSNTADLESEPAKGQILNVISKMGFGIQLGSEGFEDFLLMKIQRRLRKIHEDQMDYAREREFQEALEQYETGESEA